MLTTNFWTIVQYIKASVSRSELLEYCTFYPLDYEEDRLYFGMLLIYESDNLGKELLLEKEICLSEQKTKYA